VKLRAARLPCEGQAQGARRRGCRDRARRDRRLRDRHRRPDRLFQAGDRAFPDRRGGRRPARL